MPYKGNTCKPIDKFNSPYRGNGPVLGIVPARENDPSRSIKSKWNMGTIIEMPPLAL